MVCFNLPNQVEGGKTHSVVIVTLTQEGNITGESEVAGVGYVHITGNKTFWMQGVKVSKYNIKLLGKLLK